MKGVIAIARRDLASTFLVPTGWIILAGWGLVASIIFAFASFREGEPATLRAVISIAGWAIAVVAPAISMRSFAEEARLGTLEVLLTSPLSALELVLGKFLAGVGVIWCWVFRFSSSSVSRRSTAIPTPVNWRAACSACFSRAAR